MMVKLEGFMHASYFGLNMVYYQIELSPVLKQLHTIVLPWGKYEYQNLPMGVYNRPDICQEKISKLFERFGMVFAYIYGILIVNHNNLEYYLNALDKVLQNIADA